MSKDKDLLLEQLRLKEERRKQVELLPHLYGFPWYQWQLDWFHSQTRDGYLIAANQVGKSISNIVKMYRWATSPELWPRLWRTKPIQFMYFYPSLKLATKEFRNKWEREVLPRGEMKDHPLYGWKENYQSKNEIYSLELNSGIVIYFMSYKMNPTDLQSATVHGIFLDEEPPVELMDEIRSRLRATEGYLHMVCTPTMGQEYWKGILNPVEGQEEKQADAFKKTVTLYDCQKYADGTKSLWTDDRIEYEKNRCTSEAEMRRRIYGEFIVSEGLVFPAFKVKNNTGKEKEIPKDAYYYAGVDIGSGGAGGHPAAIAIIACNEDHSEGWVIDTWRGDGEITTATDILMKYREMKGKLEITECFYDWASRDFAIVAERMGESVSKARKDRDQGIQLVNTLFRNQMLTIFDKNDSHKIVSELMSYTINKNKRQASDDLVDALRYAVAGIPWDFSKFEIKEVVKPTRYTEEDARRRRIPKNMMELEDGILDEVNEWNDLQDVDIIKDFYDY